MEEQYTIRSDGKNYYHTTVIVDETNNAAFKMHELRCFDAVVRSGSFQAAAALLHRTHPSVFAAVGKLEARLGLTLLDRSGYRVTATEAGHLFHDRAVLALREMDNLGRYAGQLRQGEETVLRIVLGDLCPRASILPILSAFFAVHKRTRLHLDYEAVRGPAERLHAGTADMVFHRADASDLGMEQIKIGEVSLVPVAAPSFLPFDAGFDITPEQLRAFTQCVIRDTATDGLSEDHFLIDGAARCSVADHAMKRELILQGMAWGHLPNFLIEEDLRSGALVNLHGCHLSGRVETLAAIRLRDPPHGPVASELWQHLSTIVLKTPAGVTARRF
ncbi:DNA-binding transcriptional LysR family regulator [Sphingomonas sp. UYAg733]